MKNLTFLMIALLIASSMVVSAFMLKPELLVVAENYLNNKRTVVTKGLAEREVKADRVKIPLNIALRTNNLVETSKELADIKKRIMFYVKEANISESEVSFYALNTLEHVYEYDKGAKYTINLNGTIDTANIQGANKFIASTKAMLAEEINLGIGFNEVSYTFNGLNELKPQMIEESVNNAYKVAKQIAQNSESKIGKIKFANQGLFTISDTLIDDIKFVRVVTTITYYLED